MKKSKKIAGKKEDGHSIRLIILMGVLILVGLSIFIGTSYALFKVMTKGKEEVSFRTGTLKIDMEDGEYLQIEGIGTMEDNQGLKETPYVFTITNVGDIDAYYSLSLVDEKAFGGRPLLNTHYLKYELKGNDGSKQIGRIGHLEKFYWNKYIEKGKSITYELRVWLDDKTINSEQGKSYQSKIAVEGSQIPLGGPVLSDNMIPVVYQDDHWVTTTGKDNNWYNYQNQEWANAVTVKENVRKEYQQKGHVVDLENDVLQMWVWIPRYSYTIKSEDRENYYGRQNKEKEELPTKDLPGEIDVKLIGVTTKDTGSGTYQEGEDMNWYTPPGFTFGKKELPGIWIGKFEPSSIENCTATTGAVLEHCDMETLSTQIKPNQTSLRGIRVSTLELISRNLVQNGNIYGLDAQVYDSHAAKNSEWALLSYFTHSRYGKYGNSLYKKEQKEVYMNNYTGYLTGCSSGVPHREESEECSYHYDEGLEGQGASSTGNITGIYDINGGTWEYVMTDYAPNQNRYTGTSIYSNSGYKGKLGSNDEETDGRAFLDNQYYDFYETSDYSNACNGSPCKGHALGEFTSWYRDWSYLPSAYNPWLARGGNFNEDAQSGIFSSTSLSGASNYSYSFRQVLTPRG